MGIVTNRRGAANVGDRVIPESSQSLSCASQSGPTGSFLSFQSFQRLSRLLGNLSVSKAMAMAAGDMIWHR
jgi:hypothetical protein